MWLLTGFLLGAMSMFMVFRMFEIVNRDSRDCSNGDKVAEIFGMCMVWVLGIGLIFLFTVPTVSAEANNADIITSVTYSAGSIK